MSGFFFIATIVALTLTALILAAGVAVMAKGGEFNQKYGNKLMRARVIMQGVTLCFFALALLTSGSH